MNAVFLAIWHEPGEENGSVLGVARTFMGATDIARRFATLTAEAWNVSQENAEDKDDLIVLNDEAGVPFLQNAEGHEAGRARIREVVVQ